MAGIHLERKVTKYELDNKCLLLQDDGGTDFASHFKTEHVHVWSGKYTYHAVVHDHYVDGKFRDGISFRAEHNPGRDFFFDQSLSMGKRVKLDTDPDQLEGDHQIVAVEVFMVTKPHP
jgi:hypothetical protein